MNSSNCREANSPWTLPSAGRRGQPCMPDELSADRIRGAANYKDQNGFVRAQYVWKRKCIPSMRKGSRSRRNCAGRRTAIDSNYEELTPVGPIEVRLSLRRIQ